MHSFILQQTLLLFPNSSSSSSPFFLHPFLSLRPNSMALKAVHVSDVPNLDHVQEHASLSHFSPRLAAKGVEVENRSSFKGTKFMVIGHRGNGMNRLQSSDPRMKAVKENTILSFNTAASFNVDFIEFDVQTEEMIKEVVTATCVLTSEVIECVMSLLVTKDGCPIIFHDDYILTEEHGTIQEKRVTDLNLSDFLAYGPQSVPEKVGKPLLRKTKDGKIIKWDVESEDILCTLQETFEKVDPKLGFNIELKFDDYILYKEDALTNALQSVLQVVFDYAKDRPVIFSTFQPDAALLIRKLQGTYPVFFLTNGGTETYFDVRRNSVDEAIKLCLEGSLQGIVSEVKGVFRNPGVVSKVKEANLLLFTYGTLNNVPESVYLQHLMGIDAVIVDFVQDITMAVDNLIKPLKAEEEDSAEMQLATKPQFSQTELSFLLKLIPELIQQ